MDADRALNLLDDMLWQSAMIAAPILLATLTIGVVISVLQVATQIQEATLSYVPKLLVAAGLLIVLGPWMMTRMTDFARGLYLAIPAIVN
ncbi:flagellar biosynthetic protein FliQ [Sphingomonas sp. CFBP 13720]|uniref:flagellar biosynthetic protein FliQ n=1 Tax=Sphingomonas sp. CFBP 13720 TaxID=2775302 RepID=UPI00177C0796|nr:flagellar biosynthetic protein FliQ [Sphingomonas sp. CFBP 13720]MBD8679366.1 flagellar biosynthetic protein FliQ [Sphingomonas sp. CFBP 13720]